MQDWSSEVLPFGFFSSFIPRNIYFPVALHSGRTRPPSWSSAEAEENTLSLSSSSFTSMLFPDCFFSSLQGQKSLLMFWIKCPDIYSHCVNTVSWWWEWVSTMELSERDPQAGQGHAPLVSAPSWGRLGWCLVSPTLPPNPVHYAWLLLFFFNLVILFFKEGVLQGCLKVTHPWVFFPLSVDFSTFEYPWPDTQEAEGFSCYTH